MPMELPRQLVDPPETFEWAWCSEASVGLLKPSGWHFKKVVERDKKVYFLSKEDIDQEGAFNTGLTLNVIAEVFKKSAMSPSAYAAGYMDTATENREVLKKWAGPPSLVKTFGCLIRHGEKGFKVHQFLVADDRHDTLYLFIFEAPEAQWDEAWAIGETIFKRLYLEIKP